MIKTRNHVRSVLALTAAVFAGLTAFACRAVESNQRETLPAPAASATRVDTKGKKMETATLAGGCFWCLEAVFKDLRGVESAVSGYSGGTVANPTYRQVCTGMTGHAEVVQVTFDPAELSYDDLLRVFFTIHDPTSLNRQGADEGTQYRSAIFVHSDEQRAAARRIIDEMTAQKVWDSPIVTEVTPLTVFYAAEDYHQDYYELNPDAAYCRAVIAPKVAKFRKQFMDRLKR